MRINKRSCWGAIITLLMVATVGCTVDSELEYTKPPTSDSEKDADATGIIEWMHEELLDTYLYNTEYAAIPQKDFTKEYDEYLSYHLMQLDYNFDHKETPDNYVGEDYIFSYIEREATGSSLATRATSEYSYGFVAMSPFQLNTNNIVITIDAVYNGSPADRAGLKRGDVITKYNGQTITENNYNACLYYLYYYAATNSANLTLGDNLTVDLTPASFSNNPIIDSKVIEYGGKKVGYLNYVSFDYYFNSELSTAVGNLGSVDDLILDLRLNLGGYVNSANTLTALISGNTDKNQVFQYYRFNDDYMESKDWGHSLGFDNSENLYYETLYTSTSNFSLSSSGTIYCLVSYETASASEMVLNSLDAMGYNVVLIGETTRGKNVGMYGFTETLDGYKYTMWAINFENLNCLAQGGYSDGFTPDESIDEYGEWNQRNSSFSNFSDFGETEILTKTALEMSDGTYTQQTSATTRSLNSEKLPEPQHQEKIAGCRILEIN